MSGGLTPGQEQVRSIEPGMPHVVNIRREYVVDMQIENQEMKFSRDTGDIVGVIKTYNHAWRVGETLVLRLSDPVEGWFVVPHNLN